MKKSVSSPRRSYPSNFKEKLIIMSIYVTVF